ncbi:MAG: peroxiredoxin family protein [Acidimicrobiales bacterium]
MLTVGDTAPSFFLPDAASGQTVTDPWSEGRIVVVFFKVTCPVCQMVGPKVAALAAGGARVLAVGQDPPAALKRYAGEHGQGVPTVSEPAPYRVSAAYGLSSVPSLFLVEPEGTIAAAVGAWDRARWNAVAAAAGAPAVSTDGDGLPAFRPG